MKVETTICDICEKEAEIKEVINDQDYCKPCYNFKIKGIPKEMLDDGYSVEDCLERMKYKTIANIQYDGYLDDVAVELTIALKPWGITAHGINGDDSFTIGFKKTK